MLEFLIAAEIERICRMPVYINDMAIFMPNAPVPNEEIENVLGKVDNTASRSRRVVLKTNGIKYRRGS